MYRKLMGYCLKNNKVNAFELKENSNASNESDVNKTNTNIPVLWILHEATIYAQIIML